MIYWALYVRNFPGLYLMSKRPHVNAYLKADMLCLSEHARNHVQGNRGQLEYMASIQMYIITVKQAGLEFSIPKVNARSPLYRPMQKFLILAVANYLLNCCFCCKFYKTDL